MSTIDATVKPYWLGKNKKIQAYLLGSIWWCVQTQKSISANAYSHWHQFEWFIFVCGFCFRDFSLITYFETNLFFFVSSEGVAFHRCQPLSLSYIIYIHTYIFFWLHIKHWHQRATFLFGIYFDWYCANICFKLQPCTVPTYLFILTCKFNLFIKAYVIFADRVYIFRLKSN